MHPPDLRAQAQAMHLSGATVADVARRFGLPYATVRQWCRSHAAPKTLGSAFRCFRCRDGIQTPVAYAYLLGLYLGDGHLATAVRVPVLRISCSKAWPGLVDACETAMRDVLAAKVQRVSQPGCVSVQSYGRHWPCLLPQHGPGKKHERTIALAAWQESIVSTNAGDFLRGLFHSDGARFINRVTVRGRKYAYPRYMFVNESSDIMGLCQWALDLLGIAWAMNRRNSLSVARREAVAALDRHVGPKS
ncbi:transcriptional regulator [Verrucosispora sp. ts21]|uniref:helix-turn-helix domain-containing protein n=1 Tax=Verrucosispora sp. ts21 TaxID=2069341 RepID=UPI000C87FAC7|nr:helix-turn-helix domain-containing protein [Verrucosispora sp. ts21]PMR58288.1 transcriptional regulator [Verrucosispora sp. ts21]